MSKPTESASVPTLADLAEAWLGEIQADGRLAPQSLELYRGSLDRVVLPVLGQTRIDELTEERLVQFFEAEIRTSPTRARMARTVLSQMLRSALRQDLVTRNPMDAIAPIRPPRKQSAELQPDHIRLIREAVRTSRSGARSGGPRPDGQLAQIFDVILGTPARISEVLAIRVPDDLEFSSGRLQVKISGTVVPYKAGQGLIRQPYDRSSKRHRTPVVPSFVADSIAERLLARGEQPAGAPLFCTSEGGHRSPTSVRRQWRRIREQLAAGLPEGLDLDAVTPRTLGSTLRSWQETGM